MIGLMGTAPVWVLAERPAYPETRTVETVHEYGNVRLADPFVWLEEHETAEAEAWFRAQDGYTRERIGEMPGREAMYARLREIDDAKTVQIYSFNRRGERYFYLKRQVGEEVGRLHYRDGMDGEEVELVDPEDFADGSMVHSIDFYEPSPDGELVAFGVAPGGSEIPVLYLMETESGALRELEIPRVQFNPSWLEDGSGFYYTQLRPLEEVEERVNRYKRKPAKFHRLGTDPEEDVVVISYDERRLPEMDPVATPVLFDVAETDYTAALLAHGVDRARSVLVAKGLEPENPGEAEWQMISGKADEVEDLAVSGDRIFLMSAEGAPRLRILEGDLGDFDADGLREILPQGRRVLTGMQVLGSSLYVTAMDGGIDEILRLDLEEDGAEWQTMDLPLIGRLSLLANDYREEDVYLGLTSWKRAPAYYRYDPESGDVEQSPLRPLGPYDAPEDLVVKRVLVPSHDGVEIPLTLIHAEDVELNGENPAILYGYGAYGSPMRPFYSPTRLAWYENGGVFAVAHVRGGGEFGNAWHEGGHLETKRNSWLDFHACAVWLTDNGYTKAERLGAMGGSMGGVLVGRAMTSRPELYGAVVSRVGNHNPVRNHRRANGPANYPEYGNPLDPEEFPYVLAMDSYFSVQAGEEYPPMLLTSGYNDSRVDAWMPGKMAARLQQVNPEGGPHLLRVEFEAGHGSVARSDALAELADVYTFFRWALAGEGE